MGFALLCVFVWPSPRALSMRCIHMGVAAVSSLFLSNVDACISLDKQDVGLEMLGLVKELLALATDHLLLLPPPDGMSRERLVVCAACRRPPPSA